MITQNESLSLPEFEDRLWDELAQLHGNDQPHENDAVSHNPGNRSPKRRYLVAAATVALAGLGATVAAVVTSDPDADDVTSPAEAPPPPDAVVFWEEVDGDGRVQRWWQDETTGRYRAIDIDEEGQLTSEWGGQTIAHADGSVTREDRFVTHSERTYQDMTATSSAEDCEDYEDTRTTTGPIDPSQYACGFDSNVKDRRDDFIRGMLDVGQLVEDDLETVDGRQLLRLVEGLNHEPLPEAGWVVWVDPETYRPVKEYHPVFTVPSEPDTVGGSYPDKTITYEYLDRTRENLELLEIEIPEGYTEAE